MADEAHQTTTETQTEPTGAPAETTSAPASAADTAPTPETKTETPAPAAAASEKAEGDKSAVAAAEAPIDYAELKLPEGFAIDDGRMGALKEIAGEYKLPPEAAQKLLDLHTDQMKASLDQWQGMTDGWAEQAKADPKMGGKNWDQTTADVAKARDAYATPELVQVMNELKFGNHPEVVRFFARVGAELREGRMLPPGSSAAPADPLKSMFPNTSRNKG